MSGKRYFESRPPHDRGSGMPPIKKVKPQPETKRGVGLWSYGLFDPFQSSK